jgi:bacteriorhodopsin
MECPKCGAELEEVDSVKWPRVLQNTIFMIVLLIGYQLTLTFFVSRYDSDEVRNIFLLVINILVALVSAYLGKKGLEKFALPAGAAKLKSAEK